MIQSQYKPIKFDPASPSYQLFVLIDGSSRTADYLIEKATTTGDVVELTYFESNEGVQDVDTAWTDRSNKTFAVKTNFKAPFSVL